MSDSNPAGSLYERVLARFGGPGGTAASPFPAKVRDSAAVVLWRREADGGPRVFWMRRKPEMKFMGGWHAFPGGTVSREDAALGRSIQAERPEWIEGRPGGFDSETVSGALPESLTEGLELAPDDAPGLLVAALRELFEETGLLPTTAGLEGRSEPFEAARKDLLAGRRSIGEIVRHLGLTLDASRLVFAGRWLTPPLAPLRFDNRYFLLEHTEGDPEPAVPDEAAEAGWVRPAEAIALWRRGEVIAAPPILYLLRALAESGDERPDERSASLARLRAPDDANLGPYRRIDFRPGVVMMPVPTPTLPPATHTNAYLVGPPEGGEAVLIDPGTPFPREIERLEQAVRAAAEPHGHPERTVELQEILLTHHHGDHVGAVRHLAKTFGVPVAAHRATADKLVASGSGVERRPPPGRRRPDRAGGGGRRRAAGAPGPPHPGPRLGTPLLLGGVAGVSLRRRHAVGGLDHRHRPAGRRHGSLSRVAGAAGGALPPHDLPRPRPGDPGRRGEAPGADRAPALAGGEGGGGLGGGCPHAGGDGGDGLRRRAEAGLAPGGAADRVPPPAPGPGRHHRPPNRPPNRPTRALVKLWAVADLHLGYEKNREALAELAPRPDDWLIVAGDVGEGEARLRFALETLVPRFARVLWVPGNHDLWVRPTAVTGKPRLAGEALYRRLVEICREHGVSTPEDPYPVFPGATTEDGRPIRICPMFLLYDYTFVPEGVDPAKAVEWAMETDVLAADEVLLKPEPWPSREAWCAERCEWTEGRLEEAVAEGEATVLVNHWPLLYQHAVLPAVPRFKVWCGTRRTADWHVRFRAHTVVYGHLHIPRSRERDGVAFEEVSFGYPKNWERWGRTLEEALRRIL